MWSIQNAPRGQTTWQNAAKESPRGPTTYFHIHPLFGCKTSNSYIPRYSRIHPHASTPTDSAPSNQGNEEKGKQIKKKKHCKPYSLHCSFRLLLLQYHNSFLLLSVFLKETNQKTHTSPTESELALSSVHVSPRGRIKCG